MANSKTIIHVPDVGSSDPVDIIEITVKAGDILAAEDTIVVLESDKATVEVPAPEAGEVAEVLVKVGDKVKEGDPLLSMVAKEDRASSEDSPAAAEPAPDKQPEPESEPELEPEPETAQDASGAAVDKPGTATREVPVPDLGDIERAEVIEISVKEGDQVTAEQTLVVLESDKASLEIPSPHAGKVSALKVSVGDQVSAGDTLMTLEGAADDSAKDSEAATPEPAAKKPSDDSRSAKADAAKAPAKSGPTDKPPQTPPSSSPALAAVHAGPAVRKLARQTGAELGDIKGSGPKGRILKEDVYAHLKQRVTAPPVGSGAMAHELPEIDFSQFGDIERVELSKLKRLSARNLHRAWQTIPHVTQHDQADITDLEAFRQQQNQALKKEGVKLTMLAFLVMASARALKAFPDFNCSLENSGDALIKKHYINIGVAVDTPNGLVVPVIRDADKKGLKDIAVEIADLAEKARDRKLSPNDMKGGTFSISSLGGIGGTAFTPIVNWPEVAILGVSKSAMAPQWDGETFVPRLMLPLSLSYDHRVVDGAAAAKFTTYLAALLSDLRTALI